MVGMNDRDKLLLVAGEYSKKKKVFTSAMLSSYILTQQIKFRKAMNSKRIGKILGESDKYDKIKKDNIWYFRVIK